MNVPPGFCAKGERASCCKSHENQWGQDLSGTLQGAGGVGGLLAISTGSQTYDPTYDGNGNVSEYLDGSGTVAAHFEYNPFGQTTVDTDSNGMFDIRFSTKRRDVETGLYYYGYRYYDPVTGRWPSRDSIEEIGGINLYGFVSNNPVDEIDVNGNIEFGEWLKKADPAALQGGLDKFTKQIDKLNEALKKPDLSPDKRGILERNLKEMENRIPRVNAALTAAEAAAQAAAARAATARAASWLAIGLFILTCPGDTHRPPPPPWVPDQFEDDPDYVPLPRLRPAPNIIPR